VPLTGVIAIGLGVVVLAVFGFLYGGSKSQADPSMEWEAKAAGGFAAVVVGGPFWLAQLVLTLVATVHSGATGWLWLWWVAAPVVGAVLGGLRRAS
jgi:hypothetical protein